MFTPPQGSVARDFFYVTHVVQEWLKEKGKGHILMRNLPLPKVHFAAVTLL
jgi:hypothetical protein